MPVDTAWEANARGRLTGQQLWQVRRRLLPRLLVFGVVAVFLTALAFVDGWAKSTVVAWLLLAGWAALLFALPLPAWWRPRLVYRRGYLTKLGPWLYRNVMLDALPLYAPSDIFAALQSHGWYEVYYVPVTRQIVSFRPVGPEMQPAR